MVLVATRNPLNIGAAARAMGNFGFLNLRVVNPHEAAFREARSAVGASALLARAEEYRSVAEAVADCVLVVGTTSGYHRELQHPLRRLEEGAQLIRGGLSSGNVALVFGSEKRGLSNEDLSHCHWLLRIPTREEHISMNLGQAVAVCLYELVRDAGGGQQPPAGSRRQRAACRARMSWSESPRCCSRRCGTSGYSACGGRGLPLHRAKKRASSGPGFGGGKSASPGAPPEPVRGRCRDLARHAAANDLENAFRASKLARVSVLLGRLLRMRLNLLDLCRVGGG